MSEEKPKTYLVRTFPPTLHRIAKMTAAAEGISLNDLILKSIAQYCAVQESPEIGLKQVNEKER